MQRSRVHSAPSSTPLRQSGAQHSKPIRKKSPHHISKRNLSISDVKTSLHSAGRKIKHASDIIQHNPAMAGKMYIAQRGVRREMHENTQLFSNKFAMMTAGVLASVSEPDQQQQQHVDKTSIVDTAAATLAQSTPIPTPTTPHQLKASLLSDTGDIPLPKVKEIDTYTFRKTSTTDSDLDDALAPVFVPPTPSHTIPTVHHGLEWEEPNFLIRPMVNALDFVHDMSGLPWWGTLVSWALILRTAISPLTYKQQHAAVRLTLAQPEMSVIAAKMSFTQPNTNAHKALQAQQAEIYKKYQVSPFTPMFWSLGSMPFYITSFLAIRNMANSPYFAQEFSVGGFDPWTNLSQSAGWELATLNAASNVGVFLSAQAMRFNKMTKMHKITSIASLVLSIIFIPLIRNLNTASVMYFITNNTFSIVFQLFFKSNFFRRHVGLPTFDEVQAIRDLAQQKQQEIIKAHRSNVPTKNLVTSGGTTAPASSTVPQFAEVLAQAREFAETQKKAELAAKAAGTAPPSAYELWKKSIDKSVGALSSGQPATAPVPSPTASPTAAKLAEDSSKLIANATAIANASMQSNTPVNTTNTTQQQQPAQPQRGGKQSPRKKTGFVRH